jgi:hypothetical protein
VTSHSANLAQGHTPGSARLSYYRVGVVDRAMAILDEKSAVGFEAIVELAGAIDEGALDEAWRRLAARHSILTCVREGDAWKPIGAPPIGVSVDDPRRDEPPVALRVTAIDGGVRLTMLCNHVAFDGMASVILLGDLRDLYNAVLEGKGAPPPDWSPRTLEALVEEDPDWRTVTAAAIRGTSAWWRAPVSTHVDPGGAADAPANDHALMELGPVLRALAPERRRYHWSTDAVLLGVLEKAWASVFGTPTADSSWFVARDLRPALGVTRGVGNISVTAGVSIADPRTDLMSVIDRANTEISAQGRDLITASVAIWPWRLAAGPSFHAMLRKSERMRCYRSVSNVGQLGESLDNWGSASLDRVWFVGPLAHPPYTSFIAAGHGPSTLVSVRTSPRWLTNEQATALERAALAIV